VCVAFGCIQVAYVAATQVCLQECVKRVIACPAARQARATRLVDPSFLYMVVHSSMVALHLASELEATLCWIATGVQHACRVVIMCVHLTMLKAS
jgi:hypothetical protein